MTGPLGDPACGYPGFADGQPVFTGTSPAGYETFSGSLSAYANQRIRLRFLFSSDPSTSQTGWFIDDLTINDAQLPGPCTTDLCASVVCDDANPCTNDSCDAGTGQCVFAPVPEPEEVGDSLRVDGDAPSLISWSDGGEPGPFAVYRGDRTGGAAWSYNQQCLASPVAGTSANDGDTPASGSSYFYLVTRKTACGESVAGRNSDGDPVPNDSPCP
jgi:hypothetical protein